MISNAIAYISRKRTRTLIVFIILTIVLSCLYSCLSIRKTSNELENSLYSFSNSSLSISKKDNGQFLINKFKQIEQIKEVKQIVPIYYGLAKSENIKAVDGMQQIERDFLPDEFKNLLSLIATSDSQKNVYFNSGVFTLEEGRHIQEDDRAKILIHKELAQKNNLKLHDKIKLKLIEINGDTPSEDMEYEIIGIFSGKKQEKYTGLSSDFTENTVFIDYESSQESLNKGEKQANKLLLFSQKADDIGSALEKINDTKMDLSEYIIEKDTRAYEEYMETVNGINDIINIMTYSIMLGGVIVLSLILILWLRERIYEIGILLSIGINKAKIIGQFILELVFISIPSIPASLLLGGLIMRQIVPSFMNADDALIQNAIGSQANTAIFLQSYAILIGIIILSVVIACSMILIMKPKKILSKIS